MNVRLADLEPVWIQHGRDEQGRQLMRTVFSLTEADGIRFLCPKCFAANGGRVGTHSVVCWFEGKVTDDVQPGPGRWNPTGSSFEDLSFVPGKKSNSVALMGGCAWHGFITNGEATLS